jgi:hypothetical protein
MATPEERLRAGEGTLVFDAANVPTKKLFALALAARRRGASIEVLVPATSHIEVLLDLRQSTQARYDAAKVFEVLGHNEVTVVPLDLNAADRAAARLHAWFPTQTEWQDAKRKRLNIAGTGRAPATIDWITAAMCPEGAIVVTDDTGTEWRGCDVIGSAELEGILRRLATS